ncbi:MAG TPA: peptide deformylase [Solirubrobacterales bacterium]|jgi:peptide deformylase|nr:peptide deformylase [Solirubrobacterales bacterium]
MSVREIVTIGDPVLREQAREVAGDELASAAVQELIDDMIETKRAADGAGIAAPQVGEPLRIALAEVEGVNRRYPYKPPIPLTVIVNPVIEPIGTETIAINEGCLSVPGLRGEVPRHLRVRVRYRDRDGTERVIVASGMTAGTFQHEVDHLDGILFCDRADPRSFSTWEQFERRHRDGFVRRMEGLTERLAAEDGE